MQVTLDVRTLALGIALGLGAAVLGGAASEPGFAYKSYVERAKGGDAQLNAQALEGWEPIGFVQTAAGTKVYLRRPD